MLGGGGGGEALFASRDTWKSEMCAFCVHMVYMNLLCGDFTRYAHILFIGIKYAVRLCNERYAHVSGPAALDYLEEGRGGGGGWGALFVRWWARRRRRGGGGEGGEGGEGN